MVCGCFAGGVRTARIQYGVFSETHARSSAPVNFVRADMHKALRPEFASRFEKTHHASHIGVQEGRGVFDAAIHVRFGGEVDDGVKASCENALDPFSVGDIAADQGITRIFREIAETFGIARIGQLVEVHDFNASLRRQEMPNEIGTYKASPAGNQKLQLTSPFRVLRGFENYSLRAWRGGAPRPGILFAPVFATRFVACSRDSNVPASVHHPSSMLCVNVPSCRYMLLTSVISSSLRQLGLVLPIFSKTVAS